MLSQHDGFSLVRLAPTQTPPVGQYATITVKKLLNGGMGALTVSTVFTPYSGTSVQLWVAYADGSTETIYSYGATPSTPYRHGVSYNTHPGKTPVALYFYAAASWLFPPFQVDIDTISAVPAASSPLVPTGLGPTPYAFTGEWWEQDVKLLHLRARWYDAYLNQFISPDPIVPNYFDPQSLNKYSYARNNPVNLTDPTGLTPNCQTSTCKVELLSTRAGDVDYAGHLAIAYTDRTGQSGVFEAIPSMGVRWDQRILEEGNLNDIGSPYYWDPIRHPYETDAGILISSIRSGNTLEVIQDFKRQFNADSIVVAEGEEACDKWNCLKNAMEQIERNEIGYMLLGPNSNSAAISVLRKCQLSWLYPGFVLIQTSGRHHPGWFLYLLGELANTRPDRKAMYDDLMEITDPYQYYYGY